MANQMLSKPFKINLKPTDINYVLGDLIGHK